MRQNGDDEVQAAEALASLDAGRQYEGRPKRSAALRTARYTDGMDTDDGVDVDNDQVNDAGRGGSKGGHHRGCHIDNGHPNYHQRDKDVCDDSDLQDRDRDDERTAGDQAKHGFTQLGSYKLLNGSLPAAADIGNTHAGFKQQPGYAASRHRLVKASKTQQQELSSPALTGLQSAPAEAVAATPAAAALGGVESDEFASPPEQSDVLSGADAFKSPTWSGRSLSDASRLNVNGCTDGIVQLLRRGSAPSSFGMGAVTLAAGLSVQDMNRVGAVWSNKPSGGAAACHQDPQSTSSDVLIVSHNTNLPMSHQDVITSAAACGVNTDCSPNASPSTGGDLALPAGLNLGTPYPLLYRHHSQGDVVAAGVHPSGIVECMGAITSTLGPIQPLNTLPGMHILSSNVIGGSSTAAAFGGADAVASSSAAPMHGPTPQGICVWGAPVGMQLPTIGLAASADGSSPASKQQVVDASSGVALAAAATPVVLVNGTGSPSSSEPAWTPPPVPIMEYLRDINTTDMSSLLLSCCLGGTAVAPAASDSAGGGAGGAGGDGQVEQQPGSTGPAVAESVECDQHSQGSPGEAPD